MRRDGAQRHIDQAQSFNLYIVPPNSNHPNAITSKKFLQYYIMAWEEGLKTIYYIRNQSVDVEECVSCSS